MYATAHTTILSNSSFQASCTLWKDLLHLHRLFLTCHITKLQVMGLSVGAISHQRIKRVQQTNKQNNQLKSHAYLCPLTLWYSARVYATKNLRFWFYYLYSPLSWLHNLERHMPSENWHAFMKRRVCKTKQKPKQKTKQQKPNQIKINEFFGFLQDSSNLTFSLPAFCHTKNPQLPPLTACNKERLHFALFKHSYTKHCFKPL